MFPSTGRMLVRRQSRRTRMSLPASLGKGRLSVFFHGRRNTQDGTAQGARQQSRRRPRSTVGTSGPACDYGGHGLPFVVLSRICRQPLSGPAMHPGGWNVVAWCRMASPQGGSFVFCRITDLPEHLSGLASGCALVRALSGCLCDVPAAGPRGHGGRVP